MKIEVSNADRLVFPAIEPNLPSEQLAHAARQFGALLAAEHPDSLTTTFRVKERGERVFLDWLRNTPISTAIAPYSLRATSRASVATPLAWDELDTTPPDGFNIDDVPRLIERPDSLAQLALTPVDAHRFVEQVNAAFERANLVLEAFDRFRS